MKKAQKKVREDLREWADENETVSDEKVVEFRDTFDDATLGLYRNYKLGSGLHPAWSDMPLSEFINILLESDSNFFLIGSAYDDTHEKKKTPIGKLWEKLLERLNVDVFPTALETSAKISPEKEGMEEKFTT